MQTFFDEQLKQALWLDRLQGGTREVIRDRLKTAFKEIEKLINNSSSKSFKQRQITIKKELRKIINDVYYDYNSLLFNDMQEISEIAYNATNNLFNTAAVGIGLAQAPKYEDLSKTVINKIIDPNRPIFGSTLLDIKTDTIQSAYSRIRKTIVDGLIEGEGLTTIQRNVLAINNAEEIVGRLARHELETVVNTAIGSALEEAKGEVFRQHSDLIIGWESVATLDVKTSNICRTLDGVFYSAKKYTWETIPNKPKRHPNCRSILIARTRFDQFNQSNRPYNINTKKVVNHRDGTKGSKFISKEVGQVDSKVKFNDWFQTTPKSFQKEYLGAKRYELYQKDPRVLVEMYDISSKKKLTIEELKSKLGV